MLVPHDKNPAKAYLSRYRALCSKINAIDRAIREAREDATNITVHLKDVNVQTSGSGERMADSVIKMVDATAILEEERAAAVLVLREIMKAINSIQDETQQTVLIEKYVNGRNLIDIQNDIHYERRNTQIIHGKALWNVWQYMKGAGLCQ